MKKEYINEYAWRKIFSFLKQTRGVYIGNEAKCKNFLESIYWILRTGAQWRELPEKYGKWNSIYKRFNMWSKKEVWGRLLAFCADDPDLEYVMIDSTIVRAHASAAGYGIQEKEALGRSKGGFTTKIHAKVDAHGNPLQFILTPGQASDIKQAEYLIGNITGTYVLADKGYDSDAFRQSLIAKNSIPIIPCRSNRLNRIPCDRHIYKERHLVECFFSKIKYFRRIFSRFEKSARNCHAFLSFVGALIWLR